jgi:hypothetical protein
MTNLHKYLDAKYGMKVRLKNSTIRLEAGPGENHPEARINRVVMTANSGRASISAACGAWVARRIQTQDYSRIIR